MTYVRTQANVSRSVGVPLDNLVAYVDVGDESSYPGTGTTVNEFTGNLTAGTISGNTTYSNGALDFEGTTGALTFTKGAAADNIFSGGGTIMIFVRVRSDGELNAGNLVNTGFANPGGGYNLLTENELSSTVRITFQRDFSGNDGIWDFLGANDVSARVMRLNGWNSIAIVYDDTLTTNTPRMWLNGQPIPDGQIQVTQTPTGSAVTDAGNSLLIGNAPLDDRTFDGNFSVFLAWDAAVTGDVIATAHSTFMARHGSATGPVGETRRGGDIFIYGGDYINAAGQSGGGAIFLQGGTAWSDGNSSSGGSVEIRGGNTAGTIAGVGAGGPVGNVIVVGGTGNDESATRTVGDLANIASEFGGGTLTATGVATSRTLVRGTDQGGSQGGGDLIVRGGDALATGSGNDAGGDLCLTSGRGRNIQGGNVLIRARGTSGTGSQTGQIYITTQQSNDPFAILGAQGGTGTSTGNITITTNPVGSTASTGGDITITAATTGAVTGNDPGAVSITAGSMTATGQANVGGRDVTITAGSSSGLGNSDGGDIVIVSGSQSNGTSTSNGGDIFLTCGTAAGSGRDGKVIVSTTLCVLGATGIEATRVDTADATAGTADPIDIVPGTSSTGFDGANLTLTAGTAGSGGTDGRVLLQGDLIFVNETVPSATSGGFFEARSFDVKVEGKSATAASGNPGHSVTLQGGAGDTTGDGGDIVLNVGAAGATGTEGRIVLNDGTGTTNGTVYFPTTTIRIEGNAGASGGDDGYSVALAGGAGNTTGNGGDITLQIGAAGATGTDGRVVFNDGAGAEKMAVVVEPLKVTVQGATSLVAATDGTEVALLGGAGLTTGNGGDVSLEPGAGGATGTDGNVLFVEPGGARSTQAQWNAGNFGFLAPPGTGSGISGSSLRAIAGSGGGGNSDGGHIVLQPGALTGTGADGGVQYNDSAGNTQGTVYAKFASFTISGQGASSGGNPGTTIDLVGGAGLTTGDGGDISLTVGAAGATGADGRIVLRESGGTESGSIEPSDTLLIIRTLNGASAGNAGIDLDITAGNGNTTGAGGSITITAGTSPSGTDGNIRFLCDPPVEYRTASTFTGAEGRLSTAAGQQTAATSGGTADLATVGTLDTNGQNMKFTIYATVVDDSTDTNISSVVLEQTAYRAGGTVSLLTAHRSDQQGNGTMNTDLSFALVVSTNDVILRVTNSSGSTSYTVNSAVQWQSQEGGFNA